jgi:hypothetical protein
LLVEFPDDTAYVLASCVHSSTALLGFFLLLLIFLGGRVVVRVGMKEIKSWNLNLGFCRLRWEFISGARGLM